MFGAARAVALGLSAVLALLAGAGRAAAGDGGGWPGLEAAAPAVVGGEQDVALVVSIEDYAFVSDVPGAESNGRAWYQWFTETRRLRADRVKWLKDAQGTPSQVRAAVAALGEKARGGGTFWFVFIGHGAPSRDSRDGVLVGVAAQQEVDEFYAQSLSQRELLEGLGRGRQGRSVVVIDSCFSGRGGDGGTLSPGAQPVLLSERPAVLPRDTVVLTAGTSREFAGALPGGERPAFSYLVLGGLRGWADDRSQGFGDGDGAVTAAEVVEYAGAALSATLSGRSQTPSGYGALGEVLVKLPGKGREAGPKLAAIAQGVRARAVGAAAGGAGAGGALGGGAGAVGGGLDLGALDLEALREAERLSQVVRAAQETEGRAGASAEEKARAWEAVAEARVKGQNPYAGEARANAASWREVAALAERMRADWGKIREALRLSVLDLGQKGELVERFLGAYGRLSGAAEVREAGEARKALALGEAFPLGGGGAPRGHVAIAPGAFSMGSAGGEEGRLDEEGPERVVRITRAYWLKATEVTQGEWESVMGGNPSSAAACGASCPVESVSWEEAVAYLNALSDREGLERCYAGVRFEGLGCRGYRLPTEAEWEYAARAGARGARYGEVGEVAWYEGNSGTVTHPAGQKRANAWGLYDMLGNVWEWVQDGYGGYAGGPAVDPIGEGDGARRVVRGGSMNSAAGAVRAAFRFGAPGGERSSDVGFRSARTMP